ncbi:MAG: hypothetical protein QNJ41_14420 [Xenococcaceae cyanobacterium MO_188.B32]|nr:hypothetical protein [Xenococcaceae cyanobacterium MO_188.B32]
MSISSDQTGVIMLTYMYSYKRSAYEQPVGLKQWAARTTNPFDDAIIRFYFG